MKKLNIDDLKREYIGKTFNWLTVLDVVLDQKKGYCFKCKCKCGKETLKQYNKVISGHTSSCGCFRSSSEYSNKLKSVWEAKRDIVEDRSERFKQWCKNNPDKVKEKSDKRKKTIEENPDILIRQIENRKETFKNNPEIQSSINEKLKVYWSDENRRNDLSQKLKEYYKNNPEKTIEISDRVRLYYENNPDMREYISAKLKEYCKNNPSEIRRLADLHKQWFDINRQSVIAQGIRQSEIFKDKRQDSLSQCNDIDSLLQIVHGDQIEDLLNGNIKAYDYIQTKCPVCGIYEKHIFGNVWRLNTSTFRTGSPPMCGKCRASLAVSSYENDICNYISEFYSGECIRNSRNIIQPLELDLYYPEKKIAIEFNGDYWHDENHKSKDYHYNKFRRCTELGITLISIFEKDWLFSRERVLSYIKDTFNGKENSISFVDRNTVNLNYPPCNFSFNYFNKVYDNFYLSGDCKVFTCGYASRYNVLEQLKFLITIADEHNLQYIINGKGDLEIVGRNICFHLADMLSGELDAFDRWYEYHNRGIRCVFVYPPDLSNQNRVNVYKNILLYHCGFARKIYARNTVFKKYKSIEMKKFFDENNVAGYRNSNEAYVLEDKDTGEPYMCYLIGHSFFGKGKYDYEIARGACKLGIQVIGGASKLWKHIIQENPDIKSIVYYCDRRQYDQRSISHLMDSNAMKDLGHVYMLGGERSFMNYWTNDTYLNDRLWHHAGDYTNREPAKHKDAVNAINNGDCISVYNPGSFVNVFVRAGYHLEDLKVIKDK